MIASYNSDTKKIEWFSFFEKETPEISKEVEDFFDLLKNAPDFKITDEQSFLDLAKRIDKSDDTFQSFLKTIQESGTVYHTSEEALAGYQAYLESTAKSTKLAAFGTKALSAAMKVLSSIAWMAIISAVTWAIDKAVGWIDDLIVTSKELAEKVENAKQSFQSASQAVRNNSKSMEELSSEYEKLSKGVDNFGNNVSLTTEEYSRYNDIVNQIADMFPDLIQGYTEENNAILTLKGNIEGLTAAYKERNKEAYNDFLYGGKDVDGSADDLMEQSYRQLNKDNNWKLDIFGTVSDQFSLSSRKKSEILKEMYEATDSVDNFKKLLAKYDFSSDSAARYGINNMLPELAEMNGWEKYWFKKNSNFSGASSISFEVDEKQLKTLKKNIHDELIRTQKELDEYVNNTSLVANAYLATDSTYETLDEDLKSAASIIVNNISEATAMGFEGSKEKVQEWVSQITTLLAENKTIQNALVGLFSLNLNELSIPSAKQLLDIYISSIAKEMGKTEEEIAEIFGFKDFYSTAANYQSVLEKASIKFSGASAYDVSNLTERGQNYIDIYNELNSAASDLGINTQDEIALLSQCVEETSSWEEAIELCKKKIQATAGEATFSDLFALKGSDGELTKLGELSEQLDNIQNAYKTLSDAVNEYQTNGSYSVDTLQKMMELGDDWLKYLVDENGELKLNTEALEGLASARLNEMKIRLQNSLLDRISDIKDEATANKFLKDSNYALADSMEQVAKRKSEVFKNLQNDPDISDETYAAVEEAAEKGWEFINKVVDNTSASLSALGGPTMSSVMSSISSCADLIGNVNNELAENGEISFNTLQSIAGSYPELEKYVNNYMGDVEGSQEALVEALNNNYQTELDNYYNYYVDKMTYDTNYWKEAYAQLPEWVKKLAEAYGVDLLNYSRYGDDKKKIQKNIEEAQEKLTMLDNPANSLSDSEKDTYKTQWQKRLAENQALLHEIEEYFDLNIDNLDEKFNNFSYIGGDSSSSPSSKDPQIFDWIETKIDRLNTRLDSLKGNADDVYSTWDSRTKALNSAIQTTTEAIDLQGKAYDRYMRKANSVGLPETWAKLVRNGKVDINSISDENRIDQINEYREWYDKAQDCLKTQEDLKSSLNELNRQKFDNIKTRYEDLNSVLEHTSDISQTQIDLAEAKGLFANSSYYKEMISLTKSEIANLEKEKKELQAVQNNVSYGTEEWYDMQDAINGVNKQLIESETNIVEFNNSIRNLNWEIFEYLEESLNRITDEAGFFIELMSNGKLFDDKGFLTDYANASMALHASNYDVYKQQAKDYYEEVQMLEKQLVRGAGKEVLAQYDNILNAHRNAVQSAEDEKQAILQLVEDGYNAQLDALSKLIEKKKDALSAEKELYSYQKSIDEKTSNISSLEKQINAYKDDDSEDAMTRIQKLKVELEEAKTDLEETEYEKYLSDTETMLDQLSSDYEAWINERLDNEDALLAEVVGSLQEKGSEITTTLNEVADKYGSHFSDNLTTIFDASSPFTTSLTGGMSTIANKVDGVTVAINNLIDKVSGIVNVNAAATDSGSSNGNKNSSVNASVSSGSNGSLNSNGSSTVSSSTPSNISNTANNTSKSTQGDGIPKVGDRVKFISGQYFETEYGTGNAGNECLGQEVYITKIADNGTKRYHIGRTDKHGQHNLGWVNLNQLKGYKHGTKNADDEWAWTQEEGSEILYRKSDGAMLTPMEKGDMVWDSESSRRLWEIANDPNLYSKFIQGLNVSQFSTAYPDVFEKVMPVNSTANIEVGDISISLPNVTNYTDFRNALVKDGNFEKSVLTMVNNAVVGKSTIGKLRFGK